MKLASSRKRGLAQVRQACRKGKYGSALQEVDRLLKEWPDNPSLLVKRAELIQLLSGDSLLQLHTIAFRSTLDDAKEALLRAVELDEESPVPLLELAHFLFAAEDDAKAASQYFAKAVNLCKRLLKEALLGQAEALADLERTPEALACLMEAYWLQAQNGKLASDEEILQRLENLGQSG